MENSKKSTTVLKWKHSTKWSVANEDNIVLEKWARMEIDTRKCIEMLATNNEWSEKISDEDFIRSVSLLGWNRGMILKNNKEFPVF